jgi:hypothetical protein
MVHVTMVNGCELNLPADSRDLTEMADLIADVRPLDMEAA